MKRLALLLVLLPLAACPKHGDAPPKATKHDGGSSEPSHTLDGSVALELPAAPPLPEVPAGLPAASDLPRPEDVALGQLLFFDPRLSSSGKLACVTCHAPERNFAGGMDATDDTKPNLRRTPTLTNLAWATQLGWDGRFESLAAMLPAHAKGQLGNELGDALARVQTLPLYAAHFARVGGADAAHAQAALAAYVVTRYAGNAPWDRLEKNRAGSSPEDRGYALFKGKARCATCHAPPLYRDAMFHRLGLIAMKDEGRGRVDHASAGAFATPSLRGAALRKSFFHDGSASSLAAAIDWHLAGGRGQGADPGIVDVQPIALTPAEHADLLAFVIALSGPPDHVGVQLP